MAKYNTHITSREVRNIMQNARKRVLVQGLSFVSSMARMEKAGRLLVVTPRALGSAPVRNKIRRRLKAIFHEQELHIKGYDVIVFVKDAALALSFLELQKIMCDTIQ